MTSTRPSPRNHRCRTIEELLADVYAWADAQPRSYLQTAYFFRDTYALAA